jgi:cysteine desulfurase
VIYLDANASEPLRPEARAAALAAMALPGNPSSIHGPGRAARQCLEAARARIAAFIGARPQDIVFCSGGTEANAAAIAALSPGRRVLIGATEHDAVRAAAPGADTLSVHRGGGLDLDALEAALSASGPPALVCCMLANNETGVIHPMDAIAAICRRYGARLHVDAVQAAGRMQIDVTRLGADTLALSAHKMGGPKGAGALVLAPGLDAAPLIAGGGQERGRRGGTPALPAIAGFAAACGHAPLAAMAALRDGLDARAQECGATVCGAQGCGAQVWGAQVFGAQIWGAKGWGAQGWGEGARLDNTSCLALPGVRAETQVIALDLAGFAVSAGAACSSGKMANSHVLTAMGLGDLAGNAIRVSLPWNVTPQDVDRFADAYSAMAARLKPATHLT